MFGYSPEWTDAAVRRFIRNVGAGSLPDLFALRRADNIASGVVEPAVGGMPELQARVARELSDAPLEQRQLAVDGNDLMAELGLPPGPRLGRLLERLFEAVIEEPRRNRRDELLGLARRLLNDGSEAEEADAQRGASARRRGG
jgi:hypothetical protein